MNFTQPQQLFYSFFLHFFKIIIIKNRIPKPFLHGEKWTIKLPKDTQQKIAFYCSVMCQFEGAIHKLWVIFEFMNSMPKPEIQYISTVCLLERSYRTNKNQFPEKILTSANHHSQWSFSGKHTEFDGNTFPSSRVKIWNVHCSSPQVWKLEHMLIWADRYCIILEKSHVIPEKAEEICICCNHPDHPWKLSAFSTWKVSSPFFSLGVQSILECAVSQ